MLTADPLARFRAAQAKKAAPTAPVDADERRRSLGGLPDTPRFAKGYQYRRCGSCRWVFRPALFRSGLRRYWADCPVCRESAKTRKGTAA